MRDIQSYLAIGCLSFDTLFHLATFIVWIINFIKFISCDFENPFDEEILHAIGVFTGYGSWFTVWF